MRIVCTLDLCSLLSKSALLSSSHLSLMIHWELHPQHLQPREHREISLTFYWAILHPLVALVRQLYRQTGYHPANSRFATSESTPALPTVLITDWPGTGSLFSTAETRSWSTASSPAPISVQFKNSHSASTNLCSRSSWMTYPTPYALMTI